MPAWLVGLQAQAAEVIDPGGRVARNWRIALVMITLLSLLHIAVACARGARLRYFLWPLGHPFYLVRRLRQVGLYRELRDALWDFTISLRLAYYFRLGLVGFLGTLAWLVGPAILIAAVPAYPVLGVIGVLLLAVIVPFLPFLQVRYAVEGRLGALFSRRAIRDRFRRAPGLLRFRSWSCS